MFGAETAEPPHGGRRRTGGWLAIVVLVVLVAGAGGWALRTLLEPAPDVLESPGFTLARAQEGTVGRTLGLNTSAGWIPEATVASQASGIVTSIDINVGERARAGDVLFRVDLRSVVVAQGAVPAFRDLARGDRGEDVAQLQRLLTALGFDVGQPDGRFGDAEHFAVRAWQEDLGVQVDGVVRRGDVVFVPDLPARVALDAELVSVGAAMAGGEPAVQVLPDAPRFTIALPENQAQMVAPGMEVEIPREEGEAWRAEITEIGTDAESGAPEALLAGLDGEPICAEDCGQIPLQEDTLLSSRIHIVPEVSGVSVPAAAVVTTADGQTAVVLDSGELRPVEVVASASGTAVVEGVEVGEHVRTPGDVPTPPGDETP